MVVSGSPNVLTRFRSAVAARAAVARAKAAQPAWAALPLADRIAKVMARAGLCSRREAEALIAYLKSLER